MANKNVTRNAQKNAKVIVVPDSEVESMREYAMWMAKFGICRAVFPEKLAHLAADMQRTLDGG